MAGKKGKGQSSRKQQQWHHHQQQQQQQQQQIDQVLREMKVLPPAGTTKKWREVLGLLLLLLVVLSAVAMLMASVLGMKISIQYENEEEDDSKFLSYPINRQDALHQRYSSLGCRTSLLGKTNTHSVERLVNTQIGPTTVFYIDKKPVEPPLQEETSNNEKTSNDSQANGERIPDVEYGNVFMEEPSVQPKLCPDGKSRGFNDWSKLRNAIREANALSADRYIRWAEYFGNELSNGEPFAFQDDTLYYEEEFWFTVCPNAVLNTRGQPIFINTENVVLDCKGCQFVGSGTHLAFGPHAQDTWIRGVSFRGATTSSVTFHHDGADVVFEECIWTDNAGRSPKHGAVADVNSTSSVAFERCETNEARVSRYHERMRGNLASALSVRG